MRLKSTAAVWPRVAVVTGLAASRLDNIASSATPDPEDMYAQYSYLGASTVVKVAHPNVDGGLTLDYTSDSLGVQESGNYPGFDRLGRVAYQTWAPGVFDGTFVERLGYGYDRNSNRLWRADRSDPLNLGTRDEAYAYDGLNRLTEAVRGAVAGATPMAPGFGDINGDGVVDDDDLDIFLGNYDVGASTNAGWAEGDINGDGMVDDTDLFLILGLYGTDYTESKSISQTWQWGRLDALGNWSQYNEDAGDGQNWDLEQTREHNAANEITGVTGGSWIEPEHDAAGNMIVGPAPGDEATEQRYVYDAWNRLVQVTDDQDVVIATYRYDGLGRRIQKLLGPDPEDPTATYDYFYDESWQVVEVRLDGAPDPLDQYVWDVRYVDAPVVRFHDSNTDGYLDTEGGILYYTTDANFNVTALVDAETGDVVERYMYDPYGKATVCDEDWTPREDNASAVANDVLYCGYRFDAETGLYSVRFRYYHPTLGRWTARDPIVYAVETSLYNYARNQPMGMHDPSGLVGEPNIWTRYPVPVPRTLPFPYGPLPVPIVTIESINFKAQLYSALGDSGDSKLPPHRSGSSFATCDYCNQCLETARQRKSKAQEYGDANQRAYDELRQQRKSVSSGDVKQAVEDKGFRFWVAQTTQFDAEILIHATGPCAELIDQGVAEHERSHWRDRNELLSRALLAGVDFDAVWKDGAYHTRSEVSAAEAEVRFFDDFLMACSDLGVGD